MSFNSSNSIVSLLSFNSCVGYSTNLNKCHRNETICALFFVNRPFSKMAAENLNKSKLKTNTSTKKSILNLVTLPSFSISGEISAEKM